MEAGGAEGVGSFAVGARHTQKRLLGGQDNRGQREDGEGDCSASAENRPMVSTQHGKGEDAGDDRGNAGQNFRGEPDRLGQAGARRGIRKYRWPIKCRGD